MRFTPYEAKEPTVEGMGQEKVPRVLSIEAYWFISLWFWRRKDH